MLINVIFMKGNGKIEGRGGGGVFERLIGIFFDL